MERCSTEAILLGATPFAESDLIVTLLTPAGKVRAMAHGARRSKRRFAGALETFASLRVELQHRGSGLSTLGEATVLTIHPAIRADLSRIGHAAYACELVDRFLPEGMENPRLFRLLAAYLQRLDSAPLSLADRRFFEVNLLKVCGFPLRLDSCGSCGATLDHSAAASYAASPIGEILCPLCGPIRRRITPATILYLLQAHSTSRFDLLAADADTVAEAALLLDAAIASHLTSPLRSLSFLATAGTPSS
jgi:DNA repair protein RecO (recombination protein O)